MERRLVAILAADIVGYSRLMAEDELGTFNELKSRQSKLLLPLLTTHRGRLFKTTGDGFLIEFASALDAVNCATSLQLANRDADAERPADRQLSMRVGVALADALVEDGDVFGTGVNVAARLQSIAKTGGICVSASVMEQVKGKISFEARARGPQELKNLPEPIAVYDIDLRSCNATVVNAVAAGGLPLPKLPSVAVLPFDDMSADAQHQYFSDGLSEDLIAELSRFRSLFVIARNSSFRYRGGNVDVGKVGRDLGVQYVVEGSVQTDHKHVRVIVQLVDSRSGHHVWADRFDAQVDDLFAVQDEITRNIASRVNNRLERAELDSIRRGATPNLRAFDLWLKGADAHERSTPDALGAAKEFYARAIEADPLFSRPYAGLAEITYLESVFSGWGDPRSFSLDSLELARKAVELDEQDAQGHSVLSWIYLSLRQFPLARLHMKQAERLNPNDADIAMLRASELAFLGEATAALEVAHQAMRQNPFHPDWYVSELAVVLFLSGRYAEMQALFDLIPEIYPHTPAWRAAAFALEGDEARAGEAAARFEGNIRKLWRGESGATAHQFASWFVEHLPMAREVDLDRLRTGLRGAGLLGAR